MTVTSSSSTTTPGANPRVVVVGMGPGGIVSAIEAAKKGHNVLIIENRDHFTRSQRVHVDLAPTINYLFELNEAERKKGTLEKEDEDFVQSIIKAGNTVQIDELQEFLAKKLARLYPDKVEITKGAQHQVEGIDVKKQQLIISNNGVKERVSYSHVVGADGSRHAMSDMVTKALKKEGRKGINLFKNVGKKFGVKYKKLDAQTRQVAHGTISFRASDENIPLNPVPRALNKADLPKLQALGWDEPYLPQVYMFSDGIPAKKMYVAGEIPQKILDEKDKDKQQDMLVQWGKGILALQYNIVDNIEFDISGKKDEKSKQQDKLKATAFPVVLTYAKQPCVALPSDDPDKQSAFVLVGDANKSANFHLGHGANDAIQDGLQFGLCLRTDSFGFDTYQTYQENRKETVVDQMKLMESRLLNTYIERQKELNENVKLEAGKLIETAKQLYPKDNAIKKAYMECEKQLKAHPIDYDKVYTSTVALADKLNAKAEKLHNKELAKLDKKIATKASSITSNATKKEVFDVISKISSGIGSFLQERYVKSQEAMDKKREKLQTLEEERKVKSSPIPKMTQPQQFMAYKERLEKMNPLVKTTIQDEEKSKDNPKKSGPHH